jgi:glycosyltransferase involved in cell wall biosynthesis
MERLRETGVPVVFTGFIADPERAYAAMDLLSIPSLREGFVNVALEASALSVPVVGAASTGVVDAVSHGVTGLLVPPGDSKSLADAIQTILTDPPLARRLGQGGAEWVRRHFERANVQAAYAQDLDDSRARNANTTTPTLGSTS